MMMMMSLFEAMGQDDEKCSSTKGIKPGNEQVLERLLKVKPESSDVVTTVQPVKSGEQVTVPITVDSGVVELRGHYFLVGR